MSLFPFVTDCVVPPCDDCDAEQADSLMELEIPAADRLMPGMAGALRRAVEQLLGLRCLLAVYSMAGIRVERRDVEARSMLASIRGQLDSPLGGHPSVESWLI